MYCMGINAKNAAIYYPLLLRRTGTGNTPADVPPGAAVAGVIARIDAQRGVWKAPAGLEAQVRGVDGTAVHLTDIDFDRLGPLAINGLKAIPSSGVVVWGARTLDGTDAAGSEWKYLPIRRLYLFIQESLRQGLMLALIVGRALTGAGAAMVFGTSVALLSLVFPEKERGKAIGLNVTSMFAGFTTGLLAGGFLTYYLSWRYLFVIAALLAAADLFLVRTKVRGECELSRATSFDPGSMGLLSVSMLLLFYGLSEVLRPRGQYALLVGSVTAAALAMRQRHHTNPILGPGVIRNRNFLLAVATNIIFQAGAFAVPFLLSLHYQFISGLDPRTAALALLVPQVLMSATGAVGGRLTSRMGDRPVTALGALVNASGLALLLTLSQETSIAFTLLSLALIGIGTGLFMAAINYLGIKESLAVNVLLTLIELLGVLIVIVLGAGYLGAVDYGEMPNGLTGVIGAVGLIFFAFIGFESLAKIGDEAKDPTRTIPRALILSLLITAALYVLVALSVVSIVPYQDLAASASPLSEVALAASGQGVSLLLSVIALLATANTVLIILIASSRIAYGMSVRSALPSFLSQVHPDRGTPLAAIVLTAVASILFAFLGGIELTANVANFTIFMRSVWVRWPGR